MSQQRSRLINGAALVAVVGVFGCQPMVPSAPATRGAAPAAPSYELQAARPNEKANANSAAAAAAPCGVPPYTVTAKNPNALLTMAGTRNEIHGNVWTNDGIRMTGNREVITGDAHYRDGVTISGKSNYIAGARVPEVGDAAFAHPTVQELLASNRVYSFDTDVDLYRQKYVWQSPGVLRPGVYYSTGKIILSQNGVKGNVTLIGSAVQLPGKRHDLTAYAKGVLAYATGYGANAIHVAGVLGVYQGAFITPNGEFQMTGHYNRIKGTVWCDSFKLSGGYNHIVNAGTSVCASPTPPPTPTPMPSPTPTAAVSEPPTPAPAPSVVEPTATPTEVVATPSPEPSVPSVPTSYTTTHTDLEPQDVAPNPQSFIYTANYAGRNSNKIEPTGEITAAPIPIDLTVSGIAIGADNTMWLSAVDSGIVVRRTAAGVKSNITVGGNPSRVRIDKAGNIWAPTSFGATVVKLSPTGAILNTYTLTSKVPKDVAFDAANNAYVSCTSGVVMKIPANSPNNGTFTTIPVGSGTMPNGIAVDTYGNLWVALQKIHKVAKVVPNGTGYTYTHYPVGTSPIGVAADAHGAVWVSNNGSANAMKVAQDGVVEAVISTGTAPHGISIDKATGKILVANQTSRNVTIITP